MEMLIVITLSSESEEGNLYYYPIVCDMVIEDHKVLENS